MNFYDRLSPLYDQMFPFETRLASQKDIFSDFITDFPIPKALEAGCGTGLQSIALSLCGVEMSGIDLSNEMLKYARKNTRHYQQRIDFKQCSFLEAGKYWEPASFPAIFCLGNSLAHVLQKSELNRTVEAFESLLQENGLLVIQLLNYQPILDKQERILNIDQKGDDQFIRFYDFLDKGRIRFNILHVTQSDGTFYHELFSEELFPYVWGDLKVVLEHQGFEIVKVSQELNNTEFDINNSSVLSIVARKTGC